MYKMIFMDLNMPVMDGYLSTKEINSFLLKKRQPLIPIVAHTAFVHGTEIKKCF